MKRTILAKVALFVLPLLFASNASAEKGSIDVPNNVTVNGKTIRAGSYELKWNGTGNIDLTFLKDGKAIATVPAHTMPVQKNEQYNSATLEKNGDGSQSLVEIRFSNKKYGLSLGNSSAMAQTGSGAKE